ncbi:EamA domain-containing membrane protein RarD [Andreprevotia lacus DSM 23236]|jgi:drug/metabolite transporter (DMT)-like permease|uniref:EamA domain-containing membrane protein RarD n=1 Tax=Andreprevotia lacus DSM 23236 TaxID=1121001 RepID=A0A1W1XZE7_9NEIS|nr:EamA family transporter [Andreprevotia lacus]SMC29349.1 EamA domain-containing membrane protein RarD [Andreprevotia lacus DSM 23236]
MFASRRATGIALILLSAFAFGLMPIFGSWAYRSGADTQGILLLRFGVAALVMLAIMLWRRGSWPRGSTLLGLAGMGLAYAAQAYCYFSALHYASAALAALLLYLYPVVVTLIAAVFLRERLRKRALFALALACGGLVLTIGNGLAGRLPGILFGLSTAFIYSGYILVGSRLTPRAGALPAASVVMVSAALALSSSTLFATPHWPQGMNGWLAMAGIALVSTVIAIFAFLAGLDRLRAAEASTISTLEPAVSVVLAASLLGEPMGAQQWLGGAAILAAALLIALTPPQPVPE